MGSKALGWLALRSHTSSTRAGAEGRRPHFSRGLRDGWQTGLELSNKPDPHYWRERAKKVLLMAKVHSKKIPYLAPRPFPFEEDLDGMSKQSGSTAPPNSWGALTPIPKPATGLSWNRSPTLRCAKLDLWSSTACRRQPDPADRVRDPETAGRVIRQSGVRRTGNGRELGKSVARSPPTHHLSMLESVQTTGAISAVMTFTLACARFAQLLFPFPRPL